MKSIQTKIKSGHMKVKISFTTTCPTLIMWNSETAGEYLNVHFIMKHRKCWEINAIMKTLCFTFFVTEI